MRKLVVPFGDFKRGFLSNSLLGLCQQVPLENPVGFIDCQRHRSSPAWKGVQRKNTEIIREMLQRIYLTVEEQSWRRIRFSSVAVLTHSFQVKLSLPAQLLLSYARVGVAGSYVSASARGDLIWDLNRKHIMLITWKNKVIRGISTVPDWSCFASLLENRL